MPTIASGGIAPVLMLGGPETPLQGWKRPVLPGVVVVVAGEAAG